MNEQDVASPTKWQDRVFDLLRQGGVTQFAYVPDAGHMFSSIVRSPILTSTRSP
jgi:hypothetical protein